ncbi:MAG TPA: ATP-binding protein [Dictyoglomaceae bacterium]|nr:ATP-binding protein [Dictyoglomaceae bacterium]
MKELSLHILDLMQNSIEAGAKNIWLEMIKDNLSDKLIIKLKDDGKGIPQEILEEVKNPFFTTRKTRKVGLGIPLFNEVINSCGGKMEVKSEPGKGTEVYAEVPLSHLDLPPIGDLPGTILGIIVTNPEINLHLNLKDNDREFNFSTEVLKEELREIPLNSPESISFLKLYLKENLGGW